MKIPAYPRTRPSGVEWLGDVPEHWEVKRISLLASREARSFTDGDWIESPYITDEGVRLLQTGNVGIGEYREQGYRYVTEQTFRELRCTEVRPKDVLICRLAAPVGRACLAPDLGCKMITSVDVCILRPAPEVDSRFVVYFFSSKDYLDWLDALCRGSTRDRISRSMLGALRSLLPPLAEQRAIGAFLDRETGQVDRLMAKKLELIERLKEKRTALISRTVTRGLPPAAARAAGLPENPPLKPSALDWLGDIPAQWAVKQLKHLGSIVSGYAFDSGDFTSSGVRVLKIANIQTLRLDWSDESFLPEEFYGEYPAFVVRDGDVVFALTRPIISTGLKAAIAAIGDERILLNQRNALFRPRPELNRHFFYHALFCVSFKAVFETQIDFTGQQPNISPIDIGNIKIPVPPRPEQAAIAAYLDKETAKLDALVGRVEEAVERLQEYRTALITAAVTGKIDVRGRVDSPVSTVASDPSNLPA